jgi:phage shock protein PspC (stress-responsive transcriptional regulator)
MFCTNCGIELQPAYCYCPGCGVSTGRAPKVEPEPLQRLATDRKIAGVCSGLARYTNMDPTIMRLLWLLLAFGLPPAGILGYVAAWILMPSEPLPVFAPPVTTPPQQA